METKFFLLQNHRDAEVIGIIHKEPNNTLLHRILDCLSSHFDAEVDIQKEIPIPPNSWSVETFQASIMRPEDAEAECINFSLSEIYDY